MTRRPLPFVRLVLGTLRRIGAAVKHAIDEAVEATAPGSPGGARWTDEEIDVVADAIGEGVADLARDALREILGRRGQRETP